MASNLARATATGLLASGKRVLKSVILHGGSANSTVVIDDSADGSGPDLLSLAAVIGDSAVWLAADPGGVFFANGIHATLAGAGASVTVEYE